MGEQSAIQAPFKNKNLLKKKMLHWSFLPLVLSFPFALVGKPTEAVGKSGERIYPIKISHFSLRQIDTCT